MDVIYTAFVERLQELVAGYDAALAGLSTEALDWSPGVQMNSLTVLATHITAATRYMVGDVVAGEPSGRNREAEFRATGGNEAELRQKLADVLAYSQQVVDRLTPDDLVRECFSPMHKRSYTVAWLLFRSVDHAAEHMGHAQLTRQLWEQRNSNE